MGLRRHQFNLELRELLSIMVLTIVPYLFWTGQTSALNILNRSVVVSSSIPLATASHDFKMTLESEDDVGSIVFQYCSNTPLFQLSCEAPDGLDASGVSLTGQSGNTGFSLDKNDSNSNTIVITRTAEAANLNPSEYDFSGIVNPSANNQTTYVRISTYDSTDGSGSYTDNGAVAFSTNNNFQVGAYIPPFLNLCVGVTVAEDCSQSIGDSLDMGILSSNSTGTATSQYATATNDANGCSVYVLGDTMTSGNNIIPPLSNESSSRIGTGEFGINLTKNSNPNVGDDPLGDGSSTPTSAYGSSNLFNFVPGSEISSSDISTLYNLMTVSYIANVSASQPAGVYSTTLTYLASAQF